MICFITLAVNWSTLRKRLVNINIKFFKQIDNLNRNPKQINILNELLSQIVLIEVWEIFVYVSIDIEKTCTL